MTTVLALVGSARRWGNCEVLAREALAGAAEAGADSLKMLRLTDLRMEPCTGCLVCAIGGRPCPLHDDLDFLLAQAAVADALVVAAPVYVLGPVAPVKLLLDRMLIWTSRREWVDKPPKPAVTMTVGGLAPWRGAAVPFNNALALSLGGRLQGWMSCYAPGPGEVMLQPDALEQARALGRHLFADKPLPPPPGTCPTCGSDFFRIEGTQAVCPICGQTGTLLSGEGGVAIRFDPPDPEGRWTRVGLHNHVEEWIIPSGARFMAHRSEVKARRARYDALPVEWVRPS